MLRDQLCFPAITETAQDLWSLCLTGNLTPSLFLPKRLAMLQPVLSRKFLTEVFLALNLGWWPKLEAVGGNRVILGAAQINAERLWSHGLRALSWPAFLPFFVLPLWGS